MASYSKKFLTRFLRDSINPQAPASLVRLFDSNVFQPPQMNPYDTYTVININPYTIEEQLTTYPVAPLSAGLEIVVVYSPSPVREYIIIDVE